MAAEKLISAENKNEEISGLIETLHRSAKRLEQLTAGEVDAVADQAGRTFLLLRAQEELRHSEAAKQAAILNALPAHIALLDIRGVIISVNEAWRQFSRSNALPQPGYGVGLNYIEICDNASGNHSAEAHQVAAGIRSVINGKQKLFSIEYACHSPTQRRWFLLTVVPLSDDHPIGVVVMHVNITTQRQADDSLQASELRFRQMAESIRDVFLLVDAESGRFLYVSPAYEEIWGRSCESLYADSKSWVAAIHPDDRILTYQSYVKTIENGEFDLEYRIVHPDQSIRWIEARGFPVRNEAGKLVRIAGIAKDVTERKEADARIAYLNRVYAMLSGINTLIVRVRDRDELFREACRVAVETGGLRMAWIATVDRSTTEMALVATAGADDELIAVVRNRLASSHQRAGKNMTAQVIREQNVIVSNDFSKDLSSVASKELIERGIHSMAILPLIVADESVGMIAMLASEINFFHEEEMTLLAELAGDISFAIDNIEKQERLNYLAYYDPLTGLANRNLFIERVAQYIRSATIGGHKLAVGLIDLERFKNINDSLGRPAGDALLKHVTKWLTQLMGDASLLARVGADQFAIVLPVVKADDDLTQRVEAGMAALMEHPFHLGDAIFGVTFKGGLTLFPDDGIDAETLFRNAEAALKKAKASGERYLFYTQVMTSMVATKLTLENQLRQALENDEFVLHYQPKVNLQSGKLTGAEALIRWDDPHTGLVPPGRFIPILEETGLIYDVGRWALREAISDYMRWRKAGLSAVRIAVNVSPLQLRSRGFVAEIERLIGIDEHAAAGLELEITESLIMEDIKHSINSLKAIRGLGVRIAIDDFGTGFSSLSYLAKLPVDTLKIDRSFVTDMTTGPEGLALVSTIIKLAHSLKLNVVAEGVETEEQSHLLRLLDCDEMQGYLFSKPVPGEVFETKFLSPRNERTSS
jgi:diguanylate cyclase (GGDEF)-like protein/PAS domain S-box-containing protein